MDVHGVAPPLGSGARAELGEVADLVLGCAIVALSFCAAILHYSIVLLHAPN